MGDVIIGFCLDQSGSMGSPDTVEQTIKGFNAFKEEQASTPGSAYMTLILFDSASTVRYSGGDLKLIDDLGIGANKYSPSGNTALYDAVDDTITQVETWLAANATFSGQVIVVVHTDGGENSSTKVTLDHLNTRIREKKENHDWEFLFMGSGGAAWTEGRKMAMDSSTSMRYAGNANTYSAFATASSSLVDSRTSGRTLSQTMPGHVAANAIKLGIDPATLPADPTVSKSTTEDDPEDSQQK